LRSTFAPAYSIVNRTARIQRRDAAATLWIALAALLLLAGHKAVAEPESRRGIQPLSASESPAGHIRAAEPADAQKARRLGAAHLTRLTAQPWLAKWKGSELGEISLVEQKKDLAWPTDLPPAWWAKVTNRKGGTGYLAWDSEGKGKLIEFAFDERLSVNTLHANALNGVPALQQFAIPQEDGKPMASGCVPTSAASVLGFWIRHGYPRWRGDAGAEPLQNLAKRIRSRLQMEAIPDKDGYTDDGMTLAGAMPEDLALAIQADADEHHVPIQSRVRHFRYQTLRSEIREGRPVLLSCTVRLPHKPQLSWGHEVAGIGSAIVGGVRFVGIIDNFYPVKNSATIRWIRSDAFDSMITIRPQAKK